jgi:hypothetical protein
MKTISIILFTISLMCLHGIDNAINFISAFGLEIQDCVFNICFKCTLIYQASMVTLLICIVAQFIILSKGRDK